MDDFSKLVEEANYIDAQSFRRLINQTYQILSEEKDYFGKSQIIGRLILMPPSGEATVIGDIHGDIDSLKHTLIESKFIQKASNRNETYLIFLGDYGDRGPYSPEVYYVVLSLKNMFPDKVVLIQGNHEGPEDLLASPHDLPYHLQRKFSVEWRIVYKELSQLFRRFYIAVLVDQRCIMLHGGAPSKAKNLEDIANAYEKHPAESHLEEILWSDPIENFVGTHPSPRGAGNLFGEDVTKSFLKMLKVRFMIRGHEATECGYKIEHDGGILTLFSRKGPPYFNRYAAYLTFNLSQIFDSAWQLEPFIHKF
ncbi:MAG: metallophosphoesterase [Candidatus Bathyarchaeia archaeon]